MGTGFSRTGYKVAIGKEDGLQKWAVAGRMLVSGPGL